jgi:low temperature requirement protein LtrA
VVAAERGSRLIASSADPGRLGRLAYTYMHLLIVAGIIVAAVGDELVLAHPTGHGDSWTTATALGGPALYLAGNTLFKRAIAERLPLSHLGGLALLALLIPLARVASPLATAGAATLCWSWSPPGNGARSVRTEPAPEPGRRPSTRPRRSIRRFGAAADT